MWVSQSALIIDSSDDFFCSYSLPHLQVKCLDSYIGLKFVTKAFFYFAAVLTYQLKMLWSPFRVVARLNMGRSQQLTSSKIAKEHQLSLHSLLLCRVVSYKTKESLF